MATIQVFNPETGSTYNVTASLENTVIAGVSGKKGFYIKLYTSQKDPGGTNIPDQTTEILSTDVTTTVQNLLQTILLHGEGEYLSSESSGFLSSSSIPFSSSSFSSIQSDSSSTQTSKSTSSASSEPIDVSLDPGDEYIVSTPSGILRVEFNSNPGDIATVVINGLTFTIGNVGGSFVWDILDVGGEGSHTFTSIGEIISRSASGVNFNILWNGFGSLLFDIDFSKASSSSFDNNSSSPDYSGSSISSSESSNSSSQSSSSPSQSSSGSSGSSSGSSGSSSGSSGSSSGSSGSSMSSGSTSSPALADQSSGSSSESSLSSQSSPPLPEFICVSGAGAAAANGTYIWDPSYKYIKSDNEYRFFHKGGGNYWRLIDEWWGLFAYQAQEISSGSPAGLTYISDDPSYDPAPTVSEGACPDGSSSWSSVSSRSTSSPALADQSSGSSSGSSGSSSGSSGSSSGSSGSSSGSSKSSSSLSTASSGSSGSSAASNH